MRISFFMPLFAAAMVAATAQEAPSRPVTPKDPPKDVLDVLAKDPELSLFADALKSADLDEALRGPGPWTLFVPTNEAFRMLPKGTMNEWSKPENRTVFQGVVSYHVVKAEVPAAVEQAREAKTLQGSSLVIKKAGGMVWVGRAEVVRGDITASNGVIHVINTVMEPDVEVAPDGANPVEETPPPEAAPEVPVTPVPSP